MKKITGLIVTLCVMMTVAGCNSGSEKTVESTSSTSSQTTSAAKKEDTSKTEATVQTEQTEESTTEEIVPAVVPTEKEMHILELGRSSWYEYEWYDGYTVPFVQCECSAVVLSGEDAERFPALAAVLTDIAVSEESSIKEEFNTLKELAEEMLSFNADDFEPLVSEYRLQVRRADNVALSVVTDCHYDNGMNGGHRSFWGNNYDTQTGKELFLPDIVTDIDAFAKVVENQLFSTFGADVFYRDDIIKEYFDMYGEDGTHWSLDYNGVTVYFDEGEIAAVGLGGMNVTVTFAENAELFNEKYTTVPEAYIVSLPMKSVFYTDLDGDGSCEELTIYDRCDEEDDYAMVDIYTADASYSENIWAYACEPYYIKTADGRHYLYLFTELETQMYLYVYEITNTTISKVGEANLTPFYNDGISAVLTDPDSMHFDIFSEEAGGGISEGNAFFSVGFDGMPAQR